jgi:hypothetical protein
VSRLLVAARVAFAVVMCTGWTCARCIGAERLPDIHVIMGGSCTDEGNATVFHEATSIQWQGPHWQNGGESYGVGGEETLPAQPESSATDESVSGEVQGFTIILGYVQPSMETELEIEIAEELGGGSYKAKMEFKEKATKSLRVGFAAEEGAWGARFTLGFIVREQWSLSSFTSDGKPVDISGNPEVLDLKMYTQGLYVRRRLAGPIWRIAPHAGLRAALVEVNYATKFFGKNWAFGGLFGVVASISARVAQGVDVFIEGEYAWGAAFSLKGEPSVGVGVWDHSLSGPRFSLGMNIFVPGLSLF